MATKPITEEPDMLEAVLSASITIGAALCAVMALQLRADRLTRPEPRHRPAALATPPVAPISAPPVPAPEPEPAAVFDPLDHRTPLGEVEAFLAELGVADWYRPLTVDPAAEDTRELETVQ